MTNLTLYASQRRVTNLAECWFYHVMELPGYGLIPGIWDLRDGVDAYLGNVKVAGKRVLEVGTASGFLCFEMEKRGAEVVAYDLSESETWDLVPFGGKVSQEMVQRSRTMIKHMNNGWWLAHNALKSKVNVVYGSVYNIPVEIGPVHISTLGSILLHLRDPFLALQKAAAITTETMIVADRIWNPDWSSLDRIPEISFYPDPDLDKLDQEMTWWHFSPTLISRFLKILGFRNIEVSYHQQKHYNINEATHIQLFTVVGNR
jgi:hypothetical protein